MSTRREFIQTGAAVAALGAFGHAQATGFAAPAIPLYKVIVDDASLASLAFGRRAARLGLATQASPSDITSLWYFDLQPRWMQGPAAIAGLSTPESLFCLEHLARDHSMRVLFRATHSALADGRIRHDLIGPANTVRELAAAYARDARWAENTAEALSQFPRSQTTEAQACLTAHSIAAGDRMERPLVSWVIGPRLKTASL